MSEYKQVTLRKSVYKADENPIYGESVTYITIEDESGGPFISLSQCTDNEVDQTVRFDSPEELNYIAKVAEELMNEYVKVVGE